MIYRLFFAFLLICITKSYASEDKNFLSALSGSLIITTNYIDQGLTNTSDKPAFQGGLSYNFPSGFYFGTWGSNVDFIGLNNQQATVEIDGLLGYTNSVNNHFSYNIFLDRYFYPGAADSNYTDLYTIFTYYFFILTGDYSFDVFGTSKNGFYLNGTIDYPLNFKSKKLKDINVMAGMGHYFLPEVTGLPSYNEYLVGVKKMLGNYIFSLAWTDTNHQKTLDRLGGQHVFFTIEYDF